MTVLLLQYERYLLAIDVAGVERIAPLGGLSPLDARLLFPPGDCPLVVQLKNGHLLPASRVLGMRECPAVQPATPYLAAALKSNPFAGFFVCEQKLYGLLGRDFLETKE